MPFQPIESYGAIGNMRTLALVGANGSIDFFCFPKFDSPTVFAALLDPEKGGYFRITPKLEGVRSRQLYLPNTNILITRFLSDHGICEITDFMPVTGQPFHSHVVRKVAVITGEIEFAVECQPRFNYAQTPASPRTRRQRDYFHARRNRRRGSTGAGAQQQYPARAERHRRLAIVPPEGDGDRRVRFRRRRAARAPAAGQRAHRVSFQRSHALLE